MAQSIEVRCPFLDYRLAEFVNRLPGAYKIRGASAKMILKTALREVLPAEILNRPKEGFVQPIYSWMHDPLKDWTVNNLQKLPWDIFRKEYVKEVEKRFVAGDVNLNAKVWNLVAFKYWHEQFCA
jgi:asparagine synthase (glutamine-hydrolysing)